MESLIRFIHSDVNYSQYFDALSEPIKLAYRLTASPGTLERFFEYLTISDGYNNQITVSLKRLNHFKFLKKCNNPPRITIPFHVNLTDVGNFIVAFTANACINIHKEEENWYYKILVVMCQSSINLYRLDDYNKQFINEEVEQQISQLEKIIQIAESGDFELAIQLLKGIVE